MSSCPESSGPVTIAMTDLVNDSSAPAEEDVLQKTSPSPTVPVRRVMGVATATLLVVASMVGTGVFTTTGLLLADITSIWAILSAWLIGGLIALFGALSYAELVAAMPRNGGEYHLLSRIYHPAVGFVAGWVSLVVGFSAPIAASAIAFAVYIQAVVPGVDPVWAAALLILSLSAVHAAKVTWGSGMQNAFTLAKVLVVGAFVTGGLVMGDVSNLTSDTFASMGSSMLSPAFAIGLIFVSFAYSGWNGAAYIAGEVKKPGRSLPKALAFGTAIVTLLYLGLNAVFLTATDPGELAGAIDVGHVAAVGLFGESAGRILSALISLLLVSSVSAMIMAGPRVYQTIGEDYECFSFLRLRGGESGPVYAIALQAGAAILMLLTSSFDDLLIYIGFTLSLSAGLTVFGVFVLRRRDPDLERPYLCWGYPVTPILFIALSCWMVVFTLMEDPLVALAGLATIVSGLAIYMMARSSAVHDQG